MACYVGCYEKSYAGLCLVCLPRGGQRKIKSSDLGHLNKDLGLKRNALSGVAGQGVKALVELQGVDY